MVHERLIPGRVQILEHDGGSKHHSLPDGDLAIRVRQACEVHAGQSLGALDVDDDKRPFVQPRRRPRHPATHDLDRPDHRNQR